jgi:hypothetical protein
MTQLVEIWRRDFDTDESCATFFTSPTLTNLASLRCVEVDEVPCAEVWIGTEIPDVRYFPGETSPTGAYDQMVADVANWAEGDVAHCFDLDSTKHGRYVRGATDWGTVDGPIKTPLADDDNHKRVVRCRLIMQSFSAAAVADEGVYGDEEGPLPEKFGLPDIRDIRNLTMRWRMRLIDGSLGWDTKIFQHFQTRVDAMPAIPATVDIGGTPTEVDAYAYVNAANRVCVSDALGFGGNGLFARNAVTYQADSGWVDIDIPLRPLWSQWIMMGGNDDKSGHLPYAKTLRYVIRDPAEWLANWWTNAYMMEGKFNPDPSTELAPIPVEESLRGRLLFQSVSFLRAQ